MWYSNGAVKLPLEKLKMKGNVLQTVKILEKINGKYKSKNRNLFVVHLQQWNF